MDYETIRAGIFMLFFYFLLFMFFSLDLQLVKIFLLLVKKILDRAKELSKGNLSSRVYLETKDELAELAKFLIK